MSNGRIRQELLKIEEEIVKYDELKDNLKSIRNAYSNLSKLEHKRVEKFHPKNEARNKKIIISRQINSIWKKKISTIFRTKRIYIR